MPRVARLHHPGGYFHLVSRFVDRDWFIHSDEERAEYLTRLERALDRVDWRCLAYAVMSNHIHLVMVAGQSPPWSWVSSVNSGFAGWMNRRRGRMGPLFANRPSMWLVAPDRLPRLLAYVHNNPVRAKAAHRASESTWTSHRLYVSPPPSSFVAVDEGLQLAGFGPHRADRVAFDRFVDQWGSDDAPFEPSITRLRAAARRIGPVEVATPTLDGHGLSVPVVSRPGVQLLGPLVAPLEIVLESAAVAMDVSRRSLCGRSRSPRVADAKRVAILAAKGCGARGCEIACALGLSDQAVSQLVNDPTLASRLAGVVDLTMKIGASDFRVGR